MRRTKETKHVPPNNKTESSGRTPRWTTNARTLVKVASATAVVAQLRNYLQWYPEPSASRGGHVRLRCLSREVRSDAASCLDWPCLTAHDLRAFPGGMQGKVRRTDGRTFHAAFHAAIFIFPETGTERFLIFIYYSPCSWGNDLKKPALAEQSR